jgi:tRNA threonylcarbamoyladenosine biosynthesis protein TsaB
LILETSHQPGVVALAEGDELRAERRLDEARRHARDLVPSLKELLAGLGWSAKELAGTIVSLGPGSYTGLRVGVMSAKTWAYATGGVLLGVPTFPAIARQTPADADDIVVIGDAQQGKIHVQAFRRGPGGVETLGEVAIMSFDEWRASVSPTTCVTGPGVDGFADKLVGLRIADLRTATAASLLALGLMRFDAGERDDPFRLEPLYLRVSSAEANWEKNRPRR